MTAVWVHAPARLVLLHDCCLGACTQKHAIAYHMLLAKYSTGHFKTFSLHT